jgi:hypothetical protein
MNKRPVTVTGIGWLFVVGGAAAFAFHLNQLRGSAFHGLNVWIFVVEVVAIVAGICMLRGNNWARWVAVLWMAFHVVISFLDSRQKLAVHVVLFGLIAYALFRADAADYFRHAEKA